MSGDFDPQVIKDEIEMLGGMITEANEKIVLMQNQVHCLKNVRMALAEALGVELATEDKSQLVLSLAVDGKDAEVSGE